MALKSIQELPIAGKRTLIRVDFNVPLENGQITNDARIRESLPTIRYAIEQNAKIILLSHLGRPNGVPSQELSLEPVAQRLSELLSTEVLLTDDCIGDGIEMLIKQLKTAQVILLENVRFHAEEEKNDPVFARALAAHGEVYVNDAFGTAHRKHASTHGVPQLIPNRGCGFLMQKEVQALQYLLDKPKHPYLAILGGSKVSDKIKTIENLYLTVDAVLIGGAMGNVFRLAQQPQWTLPTQAKPPREEEVQIARILLEKAKKHDVEMILPIDDVQGFDIGARTIEKFKEKIKTANTIFWNGPLGMFEDSRYELGTFSIAQAVADNTHAYKVIGGGDSVAAIEKAGLSHCMTHISTGGGASLEFLEGNSLPGIEILKTYQKKS